MMKANGGSGNGARLAKNSPVTNWVYGVITAAVILFLLRAAVVTNDSFPQKSVDEENLRAAVAMTIGLSSQVVNASLVLLTILAAFIGYVLSEKLPTESFRACSVAAGFFTIASIWFAGIGATKARNAVWSGSFDLDVARQFFGLQALLAIGGIFFFSIVLIVFGGISRQWEETLDDGRTGPIRGVRVEHGARSRKISSGLRVIADMIERQDGRLSDMVEEVDALESRLQRLEKRSTGEEVPE